MSKIANLKRGRRQHPETQGAVTTQGCRLGTFTRTKKVHSDMTIYMLYINWVQETGHKQHTGESNQDKKTESKAKDKVLQKIIYQSKS